MVRLKDFSREDPEFVEILNEKQREAEGKARIWHARFAHWPSEALFPCLRKQWLIWKALPTDPRGSNLDTFALGNAIEDAVIAKFKPLALRQQESVVIFDERLKYPISGRIDLLIAETDELVVPVEVKSTKDYGEDSSYDRWKSYLPHEEHAAQLTLYMKARKVDHGYVAYFNKNRSIIAIYRVDFNEDFYDFIVGMFKELEDSLDGPEPEVPKGFGEQKFPCGWQSRAPDAKASGRLEGTCPWWSHCWRGKPVKMAKDGMRVDE